MLVSYTTGTFEKGFVDSSGVFRPEDSKSFIVQAQLNNNGGDSYENGEHISILRLGKITPSSLQLKNGCAKVTALQDIRPITLSQIDDSELEAFENLSDTCKQLFISGQKVLASGDELNKDWRIDTETGMLYWHRRDTRGGDNAYYRYSISVADLYELYTDLQERSDDEIRDEISGLMGKSQSSIPKRVKAINRVF